MATVVIFLINIMANIDLIKTIRYKTNLSFKDINNAIAELNTDNETEIIA